MNKMRKERRKRKMNVARDDKSCSVARKRKSKLFRQRRNRNVTVKNNYGWPSEVQKMFEKPKEGEMGRKRKIYASKTQRK